MSGIYLHIPFCKQACSYCDFHFITNTKGKDELIKAMCLEIHQRSSYLSENPLKSIYFGGGTPSCLNETQLMTLFDSLHKHFNWDSATEITFEANPDDINSASLKLWKKPGINRLSIGLQSFNNEELRWMNRAHTAEESISCVKQAQDSGFTNLSIDLIFGSKFQSTESWAQTLQTAVELNSQHISSYNLTLEKKTKLGVLSTKGKEPVVNEDLSAKQFLFMSEFLNKQGFRHYEISNFAKEGCEAVHNSNYWKQHNYLGIGPSAHSFNGNSRQWNVSNNFVYVKALNQHTNYYETEELTLKNRYNEYVMTGLRTIWGCNLTQMETQFGTIILEFFLKGIRAHENYLIREQDTIRLNKEGRLMADGIAADLFLI